VPPLVATGRRLVNPVDLPEAACESVLIDPQERSRPMSAADHMKNTAEKLTGKAKEATGKVTDNEKLENEGGWTRPRPTSRRPARTSRTTRRGPASTSRMPRNADAAPGRPTGTRRSTAGRPRQVGYITAVSDTPASRPATS
jgi:hypothetical protein